MKQKAIPPVVWERAEITALDKLTPHPRNPRQGDIGAIVESIEANGFIGAVVAQLSTGFILSGNHSVEAARQVGIHAVPVVWVDLDDEAALRFLLAANKASDRATYDEAALTALLSELAATAEGLAGTLFDGDELDSMLRELDTPLVFETGDRPERPEGPSAPGRSSDDLEATEDAKAAHKVVITATVSPAEREALNSALGLIREKKGLTSRASALFFAVMLAGARVSAGDDDFDPAGYARSLDPDGIGPSEDPGEDGELQGPEEGKK